MKVTQTKMKLAMFFLLALAFPGASTLAAEGSWFGLASGYENLSSGPNESGYSLAAEGGYWYLGNLAYGGFFKANFFGDVDGGKLKILDLGAFWKGATAEGLYGKLLAGVAFVNTDSTKIKVGDGKSFFFGLAGGFLFDVSGGWQLGPEVIYRHLTAGNGGDQVSITALVSRNF